MGKITVPVAAPYPLDEATPAYDVFRGREDLGKIVSLP
jgi:hypothetical protein